MTVGCTHDSTAASRDSVGDAADRLATAKQGSIDFQLTASTPGSASVGFHIVGRYALDSDGPYPKLDFAYSRMPAAGADVAVRSTGDAVFAGPAGTLVEVPAAKVGALRIGDDASVVGDFSFDDWIRDPQERDEDGTHVTTGTVNAAGFLADLVRIAAPVSGTRDARASAAAADQLQRLVHDSEVRVVTDAVSGDLRTLHVDVNFEPGGNDQLRAALGDFGAVRLTVELRFQPLDGPLQVDVPH
jgi:hypothetical protein